MLPDYKDILDRIDEEPKWYDENGVPRFCDMDPNEVPDIYADVAIFQVIACQSCGKEFNVGMNSSPMRRVRYAERKGPMNFYVEDVDIKDGWWYGDPPRHEDEVHGGGCTGDTMTSQNVKVIAAYKKGKFSSYEWKEVDTSEIH